MSTRHIVITAFICGALGAAGWVLYHAGYSSGAALATTGVSAKADHAPASNPVDPSSWGIPEGSAATRRHIETGLKAGDVDPVTNRRILYYHDPMVPGKQFNAPGKSPFMDMMLVPVYVSGVQEADAADASADPGAVTVSARLQQNIGLRTGEVTVGRLDREVLAVGNVVWNQHRQYVVQARANGFVERLHVRAVLDPVAKAQPLMDLYVPDWAAVQEEYLAARRLRGSGLDSLVAAARQRMLQAGMNETQIKRVERSGEVMIRMPVEAPASGVITELAVREGSTVQTGMPMVQINDLSSIWVEAEVPESLASRLREGAPVRAETSAWPGETFEGRLDYLLPAVDLGTRTRKARMVLGNPEARLIPGMVVAMRLKGEESEPALLVPGEALVRTGRQTLVMTVDDESFRPVQVQVGREQGGQAEILSGLHEGQRIVLSGQFLIDSEASLKGVATRLASPPHEAASVRTEVTR